MQKPFLSGFRGQAAWRVNRIIAFIALVIFLYLKTNEVQFSLAIGKEVPLVWKWVGLFILLASLAYSFWRMGRHIVDPTLHRSKRVWLLLPVIPAFSFAIITGDEHTLSYWGTISWVLVAYGIYYYYGLRRKHKHVSS